jgi:hypothetical protein
MGYRRGAHRVLVRRAQRKNHFEDLGVDGRIILTWIIKKLVGKAQTGLIWRGIGSGGGRL